MPSPRPSTDAMAPTTAASATTEASTWRRLAPRARSSASSRVRCATRIEKVLAMMKAPTTSATAANTSRKMEKNDRPCLMRSCCSLAAALPVIVWVLLGSTLEMVLHQLLLGHAGLRLDADLAELAGRAVRRSAPAWW